MRNFADLYPLLLLVVSLFLQTEYVYGRTALPAGRQKQPAFSTADSIMKEVIGRVADYQNTLASADAEIYIKGRTQIRKKNALIRFAHHLFPVKSNINDAVFELLSEGRFSAPNTFLYTIQGVNGSYIPNREKQQEVLKYLNLNIYSPTAYNGELLMPLVADAFRYYHFSLEEIDNASGSNIIKIRFSPKQASDHLVSGSVYVVDKLWLVDRLEMSGNLAFAAFTISLTYGRGYSGFNLPQVVDLTLRYSLLGNVVVSTYHSRYNYTSVVWTKERKADRSYDQTNYSQLISDTIPVIRDPNYWLIKRDVALSEEESTLYEKAYRQEPNTTDTTDVMTYLDLTERLTSNINLSYKTTRIKYSGLLNPFQLGYSKMNGVTYRQQLRLSKTYDKDKQLRFKPEVGYLSKRKDFLFKFENAWEYLPGKLGVLTLNLGKGNQGYSSEMMQDINEQLKDSLFNFDDLNLTYFKRYYIEAKNNIELANGFNLVSGIIYNHRRPVKKVDPGITEEVGDLVGQQYNDFTPSLGFVYTPGQYYKMDGKRKEYVHSNYPTLSMEYARAIPTLFGSNGNYGRLEADVHQSVSLGLFKRFSYHLSGGMYVNNKETYFADFKYFTRRNYPDTWGDEFGGVFNLLNSGWYNASDKYVQMHAMYQSPFMLLRMYKKAGAKYIVQERFYYSQLWMPVLPSYTEVGYGVGNHIFNVAVFASFKKQAYQSAGLRFTFELFQ